MDEFQEFQAEAVEKIRERLNPNWKPDVPKPELELPFNLSKADWQWLHRNVPLNLPCIVKMNAQQLHALFPGKNQRTRIIRTFIWQCWLLIQMGKMRPLNGTLRSLWYRDLEGFMRRNQLIRAEITRGSDVDSDEDRIVETMREQIALFVEHRIFRYSGAFKFVPFFNAKYYIGQRRRGWFFFTEKVGLWGGTCQDLYDDKEWSCTVMASQGEPSGLTMEQMGMELRKKGVKTLVQFTFSDRDPYGWWIDASLDAFMRRLGFEVQTWRLSTEDLFTEENAAGAKDYTPIIEKFKNQEEHPDPKFRATSKEKLIYNWFKLSNGWHGRPLAMHCDIIPEEVRDERIQKFLKELKKEKPNPKLFPATLVKPAEDTRLVQGLPLVATRSMRRMFR